jgi:N-methylhydantoinase B
LFRRGEINEDIVALVTDNCRSPALNWGDLSALVAGLDAAELRVQKLASRYGIAAVRNAMGATLDRTEALTRSILRRIPRGSYRFTEFLEDDYHTDVPIRLMVELTSRGDGTIELDFEGSDAQVRSSINMPTGNQRRHPMLSLAVMNFAMTQAESMHLNAGILRCIDLKLPHESVVNSSFPAACGMRVITSMRVHDMTLGALTQAMPGAVPAGGAGQLAITSVSTPGVDGGRGRVVVANAVEGGSGGGLGLDGISGTDFPAAALRNVPVEILESEAPILVHRFALTPDSEGAGRYRGGFGIEYAFEVTSSQAVVVTRGKDRHRFAAWGAAGGQAGQTGFSRIYRPGKPAVDWGKVALYRPHLGDLLVVVGGGGGGYGDPMDRDPERVRCDVLDGLVSNTKAREVYGVVLTPTGTVDHAATASYRKRKSEAAGADFDLGAGRRGWEREWGEAFDAVAEWCATLRGHARRDAQVRAFLLVKAELKPGCSRAAVAEYLASLSWGADNAVPMTGTTASRNVSCVT